MDIESMDIYVGMGSARPTDVEVFDALYKAKSPKLDRIGVLYSLQLI